MRLASTGLGKAEMECVINSIHPAEDCLMIDAKSFKPAKWDLKILFEPQDIPAMSRAFLRPSVLWGIISSVLSSGKNSNEPESL